MKSNQLFQHPKVEMLCTFFSDEIVDIAVPQYPPSA